MCSGSARLLQSMRGVRVEAYGLGGLSSFKTPRKDPLSVLYGCAPENFCESAQAGACAVSETPLPCNTGTRYAHYDTLLPSIGIALMYEILPAYGLDFCTLSEKHHALNIDCSTRSSLGCHLERLRNIRKIV